MQIITDYIAAFEALNGYIPTVSLDPSGKWYNVVNRAGNSSYTEGDLIKLTRACRLIAARRAS